jgi:hypothetical protein
MAERGVVVDSVLVKVAVARSLLGTASTSEVIDIALTGSPETSNFTVTQGSREAPSDIGEVSINQLGSASEIVDDTDWASLHAEDAE